MCLKCLDVTDTALAVATGLSLGPGRGVPRSGKAEVTWMRLCKCTGDIVSLSVVSLRHTGGMPGSMRERESLSVCPYICMCVSVWSSQSP